MVNPNIPSHINNNRPSDAFPGFFLAGFVFSLFLFIYFLYPIAYETSIYLQCKAASYFAGEEVSYVNNSEPLGRGSIKCPGK